MNQDNRPVRRLATIEEISSLSPIPNADAILSAKIRGWNIVTRVGEFEVGDKCLYIEVDSFIPASDTRFDFLAKRGIRTNSNEAQGYVLKTALLRGTYSQGLALPLSLFPELADLPVGSDATQTLGISVFEAKIPQELLGVVKGYMPTWISTTDEERIQNKSEILAYSSHSWVATEKIDGNSTTIYVDTNTDSPDGVCTRNLDLIEVESNPYWTLARELDLHSKIKSTWPNQRVAIQGETFGEGIQGNPLKIKGKRFLAFTLNINSIEVPRSDWPSWLLEIAVPTHEMAFPKTVEQALQDVDKLKSAVTVDAYAEGIVWRAIDTADFFTEDMLRQRASFKVISNRYLLKHDQ